MSRSPFIVIENFLSPMLCEEIVDEVGFNAPDRDPETGKALPVSVHDDRYERIVFERLKQVVPQVEQYYGFEYKGTERINFEHVAIGAQIDPHCESCEFMEGSWVKTKARDFCGVVFLSDYNDNPPFDDEFECYGGKLEFINHKFGFNPQRGTLILYPSDPRFVNASSKVVAGDLFQIRLHMAAKTPYVYNPKQFPGNFKTWFTN